MSWEGGEKREIKPRGVRKRFSVRRGRRSVLGALPFDPAGTAAVLSLERPGKAAGVAVAYARRRLRHTPAELQQPPRRAHAPVQDVGMYGQAIGAFECPLQRALVDVSVAGQIPYGDGTGDVHVDHGLHPLQGLTLRS